MTLHGFVGEAFPLIRRSQIFDGTGTGSGFCFDKHHRIDPSYSAVMSKLRKDGMFARPHKDDAYGNLRASKVLFGRHIYKIFQVLIPRCNLHVKPVYLFDILQTRIFKKGESQEK